MLQFPTEHEKWKKFVHAELKAQLTDIQRLWKRLPQRPDDPATRIGGVTDIILGSLPPGTLGTGTLGTTNTVGSISQTVGSVSQTVGSPSDTVGSPSATVGSPSATAATSGSPSVGTEQTTGTQTFGSFSQEILTCNPCTVVPTRWRVTVSGVTSGGGCLACSEYNGTFILVRTSGCNWRVDFGTGCDNTLQKRYDILRSGGNWIFRPFERSDGLTIGIDYTIPESSFNCVGENVMTLTGTPTRCATWPTTVTISPA